MNVFIKKMYFSIFASLLVIITVATTSYAWYSTNQNSLIDQFELTIANSDDAKASGLELSIDGKNFSDSVTTKDLKKAVLMNKGYNVDQMSDTAINNEYAKLRVSNSTPKDYKNLSKGFERINLDNTGKVNTDEYLALDLYVSISNEKYYVDKGVNVYFQDENSVAYESSDITCYLPSNLPSGGIVKNPISQFKVNPVNAMRIGVDTYSYETKYEPVENENITSSSIYYVTSQSPSLENDVYNFGGLNEEYNAMLEYYNSIMENKLTVPETIKQRDSEKYDQLIYNKQIISPNYGLTTKTMIKVRFYFWLEGWDSDCFNAVSDGKVSFTLYFTTEKPN